ncbi:MAG: hypothetical protein KTR24_10235 [Saprospiraceae bacterium]|nr:hypothetical protein [Saprospiraceae bacterium]
MDSSKLIDYLYGEMAPEETEAFESRLRKDKELADKLSALRSVQEHLREDIDLEPPANVQIVPLRSKRAISKHWWAAAASLLVLLIAGKALDLNLHLDSKQLTIAFGKDESVKPLDRQEVLQLLEEEFDAQQLYVDQRLHELNNKILMPAESYPSPNAIETQFASYERQLNSMQEDIRKDQLTRYNQFLDRMDRDQRSYSRELMQDIFEYVEAQRQQDLRAINEGFKTISRALQTNDGGADLINPSLQKF